MPVIINEMEVAVVPPPAEPVEDAAAAAPTRQPAAPAELGPYELTLILRREAQRELRVEAH